MGEISAWWRSENLTAVGTLIFIILVPGTVTVLVPYLLLAPRFHFASFEIGGIRFLGLVPMVM
jgi:hypothetical protein